MGAIAKYIDSITPAMRDRLIEAQDWCAWTMGDGNGAGCLRGHAEGSKDVGIYSMPRINKIAVTFRGEVLTATTHLTQEEVQTVADLMDKPWFSRQHPAYAFNKAYERFGQRLINAIKKRAARGNNIAALQLAEATHGSTSS